MTVGKPMQFQGDPNNRLLVYEVTDQIVERIGELSWESDQGLAAREIKKPTIGCWIFKGLLDIDNDDGCRSVAVPHKIHVLIG